MKTQKLIYTYTARWGLVSIAWRDCGSHKIKHTVSLTGSKIQWEFFRQIYTAKIKMCETILRRRTTLFLLVTLASLACVILLGIALGTTKWVRADLTRSVEEYNTSKPLIGYLGSNPLDSMDPGAFMGVSFFGLFYGCKRFNYGFGGRDYECFSGKYINQSLQYDFFLYSRCIIILTKIMIT